MIQTYQIKDQFSTKVAKRFDVGGNSKTVVFESKRKNGLLTYVTGDKKVQDAIEGSHYFENEQIVLTGQQALPGKARVAAKPVIVPTVDPTDDLGEDEDFNDLNEDEGGEGAETGGPTAYPEVTTFKEARDVFERDFGIKKTSATVNSPEKIMNKAEELGVSFPNLTL